MDNAPSLVHKPSGFYFRQALRCAQTLDDAVVVGLDVCLELDLLRDWVEARGLVPPRRVFIQEEINDKPELQHRWKFVEERKEEVRHG